MRILISQSNFGLGGTETYSATVAEELEKLGHQVTIFAPEATDLGREMAASRGLELRVGEIVPAGIDAAISQDAGIAQLLAGRDPAPRQIFVIHGLAPFEHPPRGLDPTPTVVALNDRIAGRGAALAERPPIVRMRQPIDLARFTPRGALPARPRRVLLFGNAPGAGRVRMLTAVCEDLGLELIRIGGPEASKLAPQEQIAAADIVVGYGRSVLEGMAMGRAAYVWERGGGDGWVTPESYPTLEADGFSGAATPAVIDAARLREDLAAYRPELGEYSRDLVRNHHSATKHAEALVRLLGEGVPSHRQEAAETIALLVRAEKRAMLRAHGAEYGHTELLGHVRHYEERIEAQRADLAALEERAAAAEARVAAEQAARKAVEARFAEVIGSRSWRAAEPLRRLGMSFRGFRPKLRG